MSVATAIPRNPQLSVVLDGLARHIPAVAHVVAVSGDGLLLASTAGLDGDRGDQLAAIVSGLVWSVWPEAPRNCWKPAACSSRC
ncbi:hypothetical protein Jiend_16040 [Micromonospora endophytica]|nr:hypothetical protein Jiend_16040 [Micromonospora endophytica]